MVLFRKYTQHVTGFGDICWSGFGAHILVMKCAAALWLAWLVIGFLGLEHVQMRSGRPFGLCRRNHCFVYRRSELNGMTLFPLDDLSRFGVIAALALFLLPRPGFRGRWGVLLLPADLYW